MDNNGGDNLIYCYLVYGAMFLVIVIYGLISSDKGYSEISSTIDKHDSEILKSNPPSIVAKLGSIILGLFLGWFFTVMFLGAFASGAFGDMSDIGYVIATIIYFLGVCLAIGLPYDILTRVNKVNSKTVQDSMNAELNTGFNDDKTLEGILAKVDISHIDAIHFQENNSGKEYSIRLESIKRIAKYVIEKSGKNTFIANELLQEKKFLIQNYESQLPKNDYELLINTLSNWIENGGTLEIINKNDHQ